MKQSSYYRSKSHLPRQFFVGVAAALCLVSGASPVFSAEIRVTPDATPAWSNVQKLVLSFSKSSRGTASDVIDFEQIAMRSVGKAQWRTLSSAQKEDLANTIENLVESRYYPRWKKIFGKGQVAYVNESKRAGDTIVATSLTLGHKTEPLIWQLNGGNLKIVSLAVDKNDLLTRLKERIQAHQAKDGYAEMIAWLKGKGKSGGAGGAATVGAAETPLKTSARSIDLID